MGLLESHSEKEANEQASYPQIVQYLWITVDYENTE